MTRAEAGLLGAAAVAALTHKKFLERKELYNQNPKLCKTCSIPLHYEKRKNNFCSHSCAASFNNLGKTKHGTPKVLKICLNCGIKNTFNKYCSHKCMGEYRQAQRRLQIEKSGITPPNRQAARKFLLEKYGNICDTCRLSQWINNPIPLVLDHINGNSDDWKLNNLRLICCNCDALTPTYKIKNKGNGRHARRMRYRDGKSY